MVEDNARQQIKAEVARLLSEGRKKRGLSMNRVAEMAGLSQSLLSSFEKFPAKGKLNEPPWNPTLDSLLRMAAVLEINLGDLLKQAIANVGKNGQSNRGPRL